MTRFEWSFTAMAFVLCGLLAIGAFAAWTRTGATIRTATRSAVFTALGAGLWLWITHTLSSRGLLRFDTLPPTMVILFVALLALVLGLGVSAVGRRLAEGLPLAVLIGVQGFRLPLELMMHRAYESELMPEQMSYSGLNFDIASGLSALVVSLLLMRGAVGSRVVRMWNVLASLLLLNVVAISLLSAPTPIRVFESGPPNVFVTQPPFIWLPTVMVAFAILGHIVIFRAVRGRADALAR